MNGSLPALETTLIPPASEEDEAGIRADVRATQTAMLFETPLPGSLVATALAVALACYMHGVVSTATLVCWLIAKVVAVLPRIVLGLTFARRSEDFEVWLKRGRTLLYVDALVWGSAAIFLMPPDDIAGMTVVAATLCGVAAIAAFALHADWAACFGFSIGILAPGIAFFLSRGDSFGVYGAFSIGAFLALLLAAARRSNRHVAELLTLRFTNAGLTSQLSRALEGAREESRIKDIFVANMSHELRTPLHGILGLSRTLARSATPTDRPTVQLIRRSGEHLLALINNVLEFSRFEAHGIDLHPHDTDVTRIVEDAVALCMPQAVERRVHLSVDFALPHPYIARTDPFRLRQILLNLIGNAVKFTDAGGSVKVRAAALATTHGLSISVADTGIGIEPEALARIFEPFGQADTSTTRRYGGTGLGLNITQAICRRLGGDIRCKSEPGKGSEFIVTLPLKQLQPNDSRTFVVSRPDSAFAESGTRIGRILLAEDNEVNALVAQYTLQRLGLEVEHVTSGQAVVDRVCTAESRPDLVLLDCQMPGMDGFEAARRVRAYEELHDLPRMPLVALTANVFQSDRERCRAAGMDAFLGKPFDEEQLRTVLAMFAVVESSAHAELDDAHPGYAARL